MDALAWYSLTSITAGLTVWGTHFIAMLRYVSGVVVSFDLLLTFLSLLVAVIGGFIGLLISGTGRFSQASTLGGAFFFGGAMAGMHYIGMAAYEASGVITWDGKYVVASIVCALTLTPLATYLANQPGRASEAKMAAALAGSVITLHFTGMAAFQVEPNGGLPVAPDRSNLQIIGLATAAAIMIVVLGALLTYILESRARLEAISELRTARHAAEEASRAKSELLSVLSHELRTPLTIILGYSRILAGIKQIHPTTLPISASASDFQTEKIVSDTELYGQKIGLAADHLLGLINEILDYTRLEIASPTLLKSTFSMDQLFNEVADQF